MADIEQSGFSEFDRLLAIVRRTRELLDAFLGEGELPTGGADFLAGATLPHLEGIHEGFQLWLRADAAGLAELQHLVLQAGLARAEPARGVAEREAARAEAEAEARLAKALGAQPARLREPEPWNLFALTHARVVLATLPRIPDEVVRFPAGRRTYSDIPTPRGPAELAARIEELERQLWKTATGRAIAPDPGFRRTYGFFDAADLLGQRTFRVVD
jgi:hypothetical protein